jgi:superfamily II DNA/RNA helicase
VEVKKQTRTLGFCSFIRQADYLSKYFNNHCYHTVSLIYQQTGISRNQAISQLAKGEMDIIFTVDLFNEGVDIPAADTLLFVRPTESLTVFTQQIGRGLRLHPHKEKCVIIDLIGNYRNADIKLSLFDTQPSEGKPRNIQPTLPDFCEIDLDINVIDLLKEMIRKGQPRREKLYGFKEGYRKKTYIFRITFKGAADSPQYRQEFNSYFGFLKWAEELTEREIEIFDRYENWFIEVEKTGMAKSYKMVVLLAMLERGKANWYEPTSSKEVHLFFTTTLWKRNIVKELIFPIKVPRNYGIMMKKVSVNRLLPCQ